MKILLSKEWSGGEGDFDFEKELKKELEALKGGSDERPGDGVIAGVG